MYEKNPKPYTVPETGLPATIEEALLGAAIEHENKGNRAIIVRRNTDPSEHVYAFAGTNEEAYRNIKPGDTLTLILREGTPKKEPPIYP